MPVSGTGKSAADDSGSGAAMALLRSLNVLQELHYHVKNRARSASSVSGPFCCCECRRNQCSAYDVASGTSGCSCNCKFYSGATSSFGGRAEKYLPSLPLINDGEMKAGRIRELEEFHRFVEVLSSWLALTDDAFVLELTVFVRAERDPASFSSQ